MRNGIIIFIACYICYLLGILIHGWSLCDNIKNRGYSKIAFTDMVVSERMVDAKSKKIY